ncbi:hypothetical protein ACFP1I_01410 [Dyadobacter subterraneus]|uniref:Uncharacterized protein n=1 Tax=Dyadobacter subterraneus TaxID=2773304 RepID=A0ABR9W7H4_9BACT|nr:hypothetical protein [Dyadobacter subterraneus]MBE9461408.1 hypothetical protein [Dyadobacter subterraneus]
MLITTDICIIGAGAVGLFAVLEAGASKMHCCILEAGSGIKEDVKDQALADYLKVAVSEFNPVFTGGFLNNLTKTEDHTYLLTTSNGREIACKHVIFTDIVNESYDVE